MILFTGNSSVVFFVLQNFLKPEENFEKTFFFTKTAKKKKKGIFSKFSKNFITSQISESENRKISSGKPEKEKHWVTPLVGHSKNWILKYFWGTPPPKKNKHFLGGL